MPPSSPTRQDVDLVLPLPPPTTPGDDTCRNILVVLDIAGGSDVDSSMVQDSNVEAALRCLGAGVDGRAAAGRAHGDGAQRRRMMWHHLVLWTRAGGRGGAVLPPVALAGALGREMRGAYARPKAARRGGAQRRHSSYVARQCHRDRCFEDVASQLCIDEVVFDAFVVKSAVEGALHHDEYTDRRPASELQSFNGDQSSLAQAMSIRISVRRATPRKLTRPLGNAYTLRLRPRQVTKQRIAVRRAGFAPRIGTCRYSSSGRDCGNELASSGDSRPVAWRGHVRGPSSPRSR
ncbi:hypothetical protein BD626DRAFT_539707 [Schizophyllum amplum]|uniref:Uncharacterized protein n=1 Tax=Schizophyllum amplum TaxID=97359 RepID=A0A550C269_9AGAR|nr:hypothetical protein BD626DRAFT_539707 [Auriculariopsis ampla]